jgi:hypothetical protein
MVALFSAETGLVEIGNVAVVAPAGTVTLLGTEATLGLLEASATTIPPEGAAPLIVTVPRAVLPPVTEDGFMTNPVSVAGRTSRVAVAPKPRSLTEIVVWVGAPTAVVDTVKVAVVAPPATVTLDGTVAAPLLLETVSTAPPAGADPFRVTVA